MARPQKQTVEYFPHQCDHGKTMFILEQRYGNDGYAFWFKLLELLGKTDGHYLDLNDATDWEFLTSYTKVESETAESILSLLAKLAAIDLTLWQEKRVIWSQNFVDGVADVYKKRSTDVPSQPGVSGAETRVSGSRNPQSKVKETIVNHISNPAADIFTYYQNHFGVITPTMRDQINAYMDDMPEDLILYAMEKAVQMNKRNFAYVKGILDDLLNRKILSLEAVKAADEEYKKNKKKAPEQNTTPYKKYKPDWIGEKGMAPSKEIMDEIRQKLGGIKGG